MSVINQDKIFQLLSFGSTHQTRVLCMARNFPLAVCSQETPHFQGYRFVTLVNVQFGSSILDES